MFGGAVYYHVADLKDFIRNTQDSENFLLTSVAADIDNKIYLAGFRALGILNKLISGPLFRLVEEEGHIFALNNVWLQLKLTLDQCSQNASVLMEGDCLLPGGRLTKDVVYDELFRDTGDIEFDVLTQECLEMMCCGCSVLVSRQLGDQLPGGKFHIPSPNVMDETQLFPRTNMLSERDFAQMDRKVQQKPNIATITASGVIMFVNNRTSGWLREKSDDDQEKLIQQAMKMAPGVRKQFRERRDRIRESRIDLQHKVRMEKEVAKQNLSDEKQALSVSISSYNGLWDTIQSVEANLKNLASVSEEKKALRSQISFGVKVLGQSHSNQKLLNMGTTTDGHYTQYSVEQLKENLIEIIAFNAKSSEERAAVIQNPEIRPATERRRKMEEIKRGMIAPKEAQEKRAGEIDSGNNKKKYPKLYGKYIKHRWAEGWYMGKVVAVLDEDEYDPECEFRVEYKGFEGDFFDEKLLKDWEKNWVVVIGSVKSIDERNRLIDDDKRMEPACDDKEIPDQEGTVEKLSDQSVRRSQRKRKHVKYEDDGTLGTDDVLPSSSSNRPYQLPVPTFSGKRIRHKWTDNGKDKWFSGTVIRALNDDEYDSNCDFEVDYDGFKDLTIVKLHEDWNEGWVRIMERKDKR